jgi:predicted GIY-YIG superfamily endonuclease
MNIKEELALNAKRMQKEASMASKKWSQTLPSAKKLSNKLRKKEQSRRQMAINYNNLCHPSSQKDNRCIYCLRLEKGYFYIGQTTNLERRFAMHMSGKGSAWTRIHKPIEIIETIYVEGISESDAVDLEDKMTFRYADKHTVRKVRGGRHCRVKHF